MPEVALTMRIRRHDPFSNHESLKTIGAQLHAEASGLQRRLHRRSCELPTRLWVHAALHNDLHDVLRSS